MPALLRVYRLLHYFRPSLTSICTMSSQGELVSFPSENPKGDVPGFLVGPLPENRAGIIVIHEWWGMNQQIQDHGRKVAREGNLMTLVIDLYRGKVAEDKETAGHYMSHLDWPGAVKDIAAGAKFLKSKGCGKVGVTGFCMGGALSLASAALLPKDLVSAVAPFYGLPNPQLCDITTIKVPVQAHFGEADMVEGFSSKKDYEPARQKMEAAGVSLQFYEYKGCGHAFCNPLNVIGPNYNEEAAKLAMTRMYEFFNNNLAS